MSLNRPAKITFVAIAQILCGVLYVLVAATSYQVITSSSFYDPFPVPETLPPKFLPFVHIMLGYGVLGLCAVVFGAGMLWLKRWAWLSSLIVQAASILYSLLHSYVVLDTTSHPRLQFQNLYIPFLHVVIFILLLLPGFRKAFIPISQRDHLE